MGVWDRDDEVDELGGPLDVEVTIVDDVELLLDGGAGKMICGYWKKNFFFRQIMALKIVTLLKKSVVLHFDFHFCFVFFSKTEGENSTFQGFSWWVKLNAWPL